MEKCSAWSLLPMAAVVLVGLVFLSGCPRIVDSTGSIVETGDSIFSDENSEDIPETTITMMEIGGNLAPEIGAVPVESLETEQYNAVINWEPEDNPFEPGRVYTATIILTAKEGYTLNGIAADSFTVSGADSVSHAENSGIITAIFPTTDSLLSLSFEDGLNEEIMINLNLEHVIGVGSPSRINVAVADGYDSYTWYINGTLQDMFSGEPVLRFWADELGYGVYTFTVIVEQNGIPYSASIIVRII